MAEHCIGVEVAGLDAANQGAVHHVPGARLGDCRSIQAGALGIQVTGLPPADEAHHAGQPGDRAYPIATVETLQDHAPIGLIERAATGRIEATIADDDGKYSHCGICGKARKPEF